MKHNDLKCDMKIAQIMNMSISFDGWSKVPQSDYDGIEGKGLLTLFPKRLPICKMILAICPNEAKEIRMCAG